MAKNLKRTILSDKMPNNKHIIWAEPQGEKINLKIFNNGLWRLASSGSNDSSLYEVDPNAFLITENTNLEEFPVLVLTFSGVDINDLSISEEEFTQIINSTINSTSYRTESHGMATLVSPFNLNTLIELYQQGVEPTLVFNCADGAVATITIEGTEFEGGITPNTYTLTSSSTLKDITQARMGGKTFSTVNHGTAKMGTSSSGIIFLCEDGYMYEYNPGLEGATEFRILPPSTRYYLVPKDNDDKFDIYDRITGDPVSIENILDLTEALYLDKNYVLSIIQLLNDQTEHVNSIIFKLNEISYSLETTGTSFGKTFWYGMCLYEYYQGHYISEQIMLRLLVNIWPSNSYARIDGKINLYTSGLTPEHVQPS